MIKSLVQVDVGMFEGAICSDNFNRHLSILGASKPSSSFLELRWGDR